MIGPNKIIPVIRVCGIETKKILNILLGLFRGYVPDEIPIGILEINHFNHPSVQFSPPIP